MKKSIVVALVSVACSGAGTSPSTTSPFIAGFTPTPAAADETQIVSPVWKDIPAGQDVTYCSYLASPFGKDVDVVSATGFQSLFGHHVLLLAVGADAPFKDGDTHVCTDQDMNKAVYISGAGSEKGGSIVIPEGIAVRVKAGSRLMLQSHWINTSSQSTVGQAAFNVKVAEPSASRQQAQLFAVYGTQFDVKPHQAGRMSTECKMPRDVQLFELAGHEHEWGTHVKIEHVDGAGVATLVYETDWKNEYQSRPPQNYYDIHKPLTFLKGESLRITCDWNNTTDSDLLFPREMCVAAGMYFPAQTTVQCGDGVWDESSP